ncbi:hypothetical protein [Helicobacter sp. MIT 05-5294]|uniref:hypothetical protein n=1 Tax=Helicobacter sp. MIT 05-5294 TaxID=1548150 RepID=UPI00051FBCD6|nr:hypothetical protein [Helicobacter sp. MIT 05-5294]TLD85577.1 hypothetical protein LS69_009005 [Helicobacter sp. MIT 05-5294]
MDENYTDLVDLPETHDFYGDLDYDAILSFDKGFRTKETLDTTAKYVAKENGLDEQKVREELERANEREKEQKNREEALERAKEQEKLKENAKEPNLEQTLQNEDLTLENHTRGLEYENPTLGLHNDLLNPHEPSLEQEQALKSLESSLEVENVNVQNVLNTNLAYKETQTKINKLLEIKTDSYFPQQKLELSQTSIKGIECHDKLSEVLNANLSLKETQAEIELLESQKKEEKEKSQEDSISKEESQTNTQDLQLQNIDSKEDSIDEKLQALKDKLQDDKDKLQEAVGKFSAQDIDDLLQSLYNLDKALAQMMKDQQEIAEHNRAQRESELKELAEKSKIEFLLKLTDEMTDKYVQVQDNVALMQEEKSLYESLNKEMDKGVDKEAIQKKLQSIEKTHPNFRENYQKTFKKAQDYVKGITKEQTKEKPQGMHR